MPGVAPGAGKPAGRAALLFALLLVVALGDGCKKSTPAPALLPPAPVKTVARVRWLGKQRLTADTNAAFVMGIWNLEESKKLETQTLDRLAAGLVASNQVSVTGAQSPITNRQSQIAGPASLLRPLLDDLLQQESFVEVRQATNQPGELAFAIRLNDERAHLWETNLAAVLESLTGSRATAAPGRTNGWQLRFTSHQSPITNHSSAVTRTLELARAGEWTIMGLGQETNALAAELRGLIQREGVPFARQPKDFWLYADVDLRRVASALSLGCDLPADLPRLTVSLSGDGQTVRTLGQLDFPKPLPEDLGQWNIPTHLIHDPLVSFTAIRGIGPWLSSLKIWPDLGLGAPPSQFYFWAENGLPFLSFCAARLPNASNQVSQLAGRLVQQANLWLATNSRGWFERSTNSNGVTWQDLPMVMPWLQSGSSGADDLAFGGLVPDISTNRPPRELFLQVTDPTNLVAYDWEITGTRVGQWLYFGQFFRMFLHQAQLPPKSASVAWLNALEFKLGNCVSAVTRTGPAQLSLLRRSSLGFTSVELHLLADWLESPQFPRGLHTFLAPPEPPLRKRPAHPASGTSTNSAPPAHH
jgi:hypothetical protein